MISANCSVFRFVPAACMKLQFNFSTCGHNSCPWLTITLQRRQNIVQTTYCGRVWWKQKLHPSGTSSVTIGCRKPSVRAPRWVGDAMVDRGKCWMDKVKEQTSVPMLVLLKIAEKTERESLLNRSPCSPDDPIGQGTERNWNVNQRANESSDCLFFTRTNFPCRFNPQHGWCGRSQTVTTLDQWINVSNKQRPGSSDRFKTL